MAPHEEFEVEVAGGPVAFKGRDDTYNLRAPNRFLWDSLEPGSDAAEIRDYWRGLIALRMSDHGRVFRVARVPEGHYQWFTPGDRHLLGYLVGGEVLVVTNNGAWDRKITVDLPEGSWRRVANQDVVDLSGVPGPDARLSGGEQELGVPAGSFLVWVRE